jgi:hypothetical protein
VALPHSLSSALPYSWFAAGISVGIGSHLFWDCVGSRSHKIVFVPYWMALRASASRIYLLAGALLCLIIGAYFGAGVPAPSYQLPEWLPWSS